MIYLFAFLFSFVTFAEDLFYSPRDIVQETYKIKQKSYMEASYGDSKTHDGKGLIPFNRFQRGRLNARSIIEAKDLEAKYSALLDVQIGTDVNEDQSTMFYINRGYFQLQNVDSQSIKTKVKIGIQNTALADLAVNTSTPMKNGQGINGNWYRYIQMPVVNSAGGYNPTFLLHSNPMSSQGFTDATFLFSQNGGNLNYVQPSPWWSSSNVGIAFGMERLHGLKLAFSYQPSQNTGNFGINANGGYDRRGIQLDAHGNQMFTRDLTSFVLNYLNEFEGVAVNTSLGYETANYRTDSTVDISRHKLSQYTAGLNLSYLGVTIGGSYSNAGNSVLLKHNANHVNSFSARNGTMGASSGTDLYNLSQSSSLLDFKDTYNFDIGISYAISRFQVGVAHAKSHYADNHFNTTIISLSDDISATQKLKLTALYELGFYEFNSGNYFQVNGGNIDVISVPKMKGFMASIGLRISI